MIREEIMAKLDDLRLKVTSPFDIEELSKIEKKAKVGLATIDLQNNEGIQIILDSYRKRVDNIDFRLCNDSSLLNEEGKVFLKEKTFIESFLRFFTRAEKSVDNINKKLNNL